MSPLSNRPSFQPSVSLALAIGLSCLMAGCLVAQTSERQLAKRILDLSGVQGGLVVHVGCNDGKLTTALHASDSYLVQGLTANQEKRKAAREHIRSQGVYGPVSVRHWPGPYLPFADNLVNLLVVHDASAVAQEEMMRVLAPKGVALVRKQGRWAKSVKPRPKEIDVWTHYMHDPGGNAVAHDSVVGPPRHQQWVGSPRWSRHHDHMGSMSALVSTEQRIFYILDEGPTSSIVLPPQWKLIARDAFNGTVLWKRAIKEWHTHLWPLKSGPAMLPRRLVAVDDTVYVTLSIDAPLTALDAATGKTKHTYEGTKATEEILFVDGVLYLVVADPPPSRPEYRTVRDVRRAVSDRRWSGGDKTVMAVRADSGEILWKRQSWVVPVTLSADKQRVYFHDRKKIVALDRASGEIAWESEPVPVWKGILSWFAPTLVVHDDVVLFAGGEKMIPHRGGKDTMTALSAKTGKKLWTADHPPCGYQSPEDLLVADGLIWSAATTSGGYDGVFQGVNPRSGDVEVRFPPDVETYWFHHRCYRSKATDRYVLTSRTGIEFVDIKNKQWLIHHWVRGGCLYGIMPCNGMVYAPMHDCACYPEAKLFGFNALAPESPSRTNPPPIPDQWRLTKGPAYGKIAAKGADGSGHDWPTYRGDAARSGHMRHALPASLEPAWTKDLGGRLSALAVADGTLFVAKVDTHTLHALSAKTGEPLWSFTADARIDSPPTVHEGMVLFGSQDGCVYCLRASDGALVWRFWAAPSDRQIVAFEQVESLWPVHGTILVEDGSAYFVAGRSVFLDGGLRLYRLEAKTGRVISENVLDSEDPTTHKSLQDRIQVLNMPVGLPDILSTDGERLYMKSQVFDVNGKRTALGPHSGDPAKQGAVQRGETAHLFCPTGFLDSAWFHRSYWVYGRSFAGGHAGYYQAGKHAPAGRILTFDDSRVYGYGRKPQYYRWTTPLEYHLFATTKQPPAATQPARKPAKGSVVYVEKSPSQDPTGKPLAVEAWVKAKKPSGVILARGGPAHGYALILEKGHPSFVVRIDNDVCAVQAEEKVVGKWVHLAGVLTPEKKLEIYINGKLANTAKAKGFIVSDPHQPMEIGADEQGGVGNYKSPHGFTGIIDEVRIFYGPVTAEEIRAHAERPGETDVKQAKVIASYSFDKGKARDGSGNNNHGKVENTVGVTGKAGYALSFKGRTQPRGLRHLVKFDWSTDVPLIVRAMLLAENTLFIAGPPDVVNEDNVLRNLSGPDMESKLEQQRAAVWGKKGALLWSVSVEDGEKRSACGLPSPPVFDGMAAADGRLYIALENGQIVCMGE